MRVLIDCTHLEGIAALLRCKRMIRTYVLDGSFIHMEDGRLVFQELPRALEQYRLDVSRTCSRRSMSNERVIRNTLSKKADIVRSSFFPIPAELCIYSPREGCSVHSERCDIAFIIMCVLFIAVTCRTQLSLSLFGTCFRYFSSQYGHLTSCVHVATWMRPI